MTPSIPGLKITLLVPRWIRTTGKSGTEEEKEQLITLGFAKPQINKIDPKRPFSKAKKQNIALNNGQKILSPAILVATAFLPKMAKSLLGLAVGPLLKASGKSLLNKKNLHLSKSTTFQPQKSLETFFFSSSRAFSSPFSSQTSRNHETEVQDRPKSKRLM